MREVFKRIIPASLALSIAFWAGSVVGKKSVEAESREPLELPEIAGEETSSTEDYIIELKEPSTAMWDSVTLRGTSFGPVPLHVELEAKWLYLEGSITSLIVKVGDESFEIATEEVKTYRDLVVPLASVKYSRDLPLERIFVAVPFEPSSVPQGPSEHYVVFDFDRNTGQTTAREFDWRK